MRKDDIELLMLFLGPVSFVASIFWLTWRMDSISKFEREKLEASLLNS